jgi:hypothetical protein
MSKKFYYLSPEAFALIAGAKMPLQQRQILKAMALENVPMIGSDAVKSAIALCGLSTRQDHKVLYAWYARTNEGFGVVQVAEGWKPEPVTPVEDVPEEIEIEAIPAEIAIEAEKTSRRRHAA